MHAKGTKLRASAKNKEREGGGRGGAKETILFPHTPTLSSLTPSPVIPIFLLNPGALVCLLGLSAWEMERKRLLLRLIYLKALGKYSKQLM